MKYIDCNIELARVSRKSNGRYFCDAKIFKHAGYCFGLHEDMLTDDYVVTELKTGSKWAVGKNKSEAIKRMKEVFVKYRPTAIDEELQRASLRAKTEGYKLPLNKNATDLLQ